MIPISYELLEDDMHAILMQAFEHGWRQATKRETGTPILGREAARAMTRGQQTMVDSYMDSLNNLTVPD